METMNYGLINYQKQNGKTGIFWQAEQKKKPDRKFGYRSKDQKFSIRQHPKNFDRFESDDEQMTIGGTDKESEKKKPEKDFIARNRTLVKNKNKKTVKKDSNAPKNDSDTLMTLTQAQLNAILASVGKVASGKEDNLRISIVILGPAKFNSGGSQSTRKNITLPHSRPKNPPSDECLQRDSDLGDSSKNEIKIESPRKSKEFDSDRYSDHHSDDEDNKYSRDRHEKEKKSSRKKKENKEESIFDLLGDTTEKNKKEDVKKYKKKKEYKLYDDEEDNDDHFSYKEENKRGASRERRRERSRERERHRKRDPSRSRERDIRDRERESSREHSRDRYRDYDRKKKKEKNHDGELIDKNKVKDRGREDKKRKDRDTSLDKHKDKDRVREDKSKHKERDTSLDKRKDKDRDHQRSKDGQKDEKKEKESDKENEETQPEKVAVQNVVSPRELAGIPLALPWKHMTKAERRRLMLARMQAEDAAKQAAVAKLTLEEDERLQKERQERKEYDKKRAEKKAREERKERDKREREKSEERERERRWEEGREREYRGRREKEERRDDSRERRERRQRDKSRERESHRHRDKSHERKRSPSVSEEDDTVNNKSNDKNESKKEVLHLPPAGPRALTLAEKKRLQWEQERKEQEKRYDPWGRPGAGAPIRTRSGNIAADYRSRQEETLRMSYEQEEERKNNKKYQEESPPSTVPQQNVPPAMRSSFVLGEIAPDANSFENTKEVARRQWLMDLEKQMEEKRQLQMQETEKSLAADTWADKFSSNKPTTYQADPYSPRGIGLDTGRVSSAPQPGQPDNDEDRTHIRGQNVYMDPVTRKELEEKKKRLLEHQKAVMEQVQEKQLLKQRERERKMKEDMEEERKLQAERDRLQRQFEQEQMKVKMKEARRQQEVEKLKAAMDEAHEQALREKMNKRMQHLEKGGHDVTQLKATLQEDPRTGRYPATGRLTGRELMPEYARSNLAQISPRSKFTVVAPTHVPGLDLDMSPRGGAQTVTKFITTDQSEVADGMYTENRVLTPSQHRASYRSLDPHLPRREFGTQTGMRDHSPNDDFIDIHDKNVDLEKILDLASNREQSEIEIMYKGRKVRVKSASKEDVVRSKPKSEKPKNGQLKTKKGEKKEKPLWNFQNKKQKKPVKQSEKDLNFNEKRKQSEMRRIKRERELLALVDLNRDIIPTEKRTPGNSRGQSPVSDRGGRTPRGREKERVRRSRSHSPENLHNGTQRSARSQSPPSNRRSPPVPALRYRPDPLEGNDALSSDRRVQKYEDRDPLDVPLTDGDFVPFTRTVEILDPAHAGSPLPLSRETTSVANARKAYIKGMKPADYGKKVNRYEDRMKMPGEQQGPAIKDPILNPALVTEHPTQRQDAILEQLSSLKMNLMQRQRELETFSPSDFE